MRSVDPDAWWTSPVFYPYPEGGPDREFYTIQHLAAALGRSVHTIRKWESKGVVPKPRFKGMRYGERLYTRKQIDGIVDIATEERIDRLEAENRSFQQTRFTERVLALLEGPPF